MKNLYIYILLLSVSFGYSQTHGYTYFDSGTFEEWTNSDGSITNLSLEDRNPYSFKKSCDGSNTVNGEMSIRNLSYFQDNYVSDDAATIYMEVKNNNPFDIHLRLGFANYEGSKIVTTEPVIVPANTDTWDSWIEFPIWPGVFTLIKGTNSITEVLSQAFELSIIHNPDISFNGAYENGNLEIDTVGTLYLLDAGDFKNQLVSIYPVPTKDVLYIKSNNSKIDRLEIYDSLGRMKKIEASNLHEIDLSAFSNGVYFLKIISAKGVQTKKIIKN